MMAVTTFGKAWWSFLFLLSLAPVAGGYQELIKAHHMRERGKQYHRSLALFVLPFEITWRFVIADVEGVPPDRQPTQLEYDGIRQATEDWFSVEIPFFYAQTESFSFHDIECRVEGTVYNPNAEWVHEVLLGCQVIWDAIKIDDTPDATKFLIDMNADYLLDNFVDPYLRSADPQNPRNIFQFSQRVGYITEGAGTRGPFPATEETGTPDTQAPTTAPGPQSPPAPTPSPTTAPPMPMPTTMEPATTTTTEPTPGPTPPPTPGPGVTSPPIPEPTPSPGPPQTPMPTDSSLPVKKIAPPAKCGSLASKDGRGGAAADAKGCVSRRLLEAAQIGIGGGRRRKRKLKGSNY